MKTIEWIKQLVEVESVLKYEGFDLTRTLTSEEQSKAKEIVAVGTNGNFVYWPNQYGYRGEILQRKMIAWDDLYSVLLQLPFCQCVQILLPLDDEILKFFRRRDPETMEKLRVQGYIIAKPHVRKLDQFIAISIYLYSHFVNYDEDGYGGGEDDYYIIGIIDPQGRWALMPQECVDFRRGTVEDTDPSDFLSEDVRKQIFV